MKAIDTFLSRLDKVRSIGPSKWQARCPAHQDNNPSLSVAVGREGQVIFTCWSGCERQAVIDALSLEWSDLYDDDLISFNRTVASFTRRDRAIKRKREAVSTNYDRDSVLLAVAKGKREAGEKLTQREMDIELEAFMRSRGG